MSLQSIIQQIKTANLPGENTALRVGSAFEQMDTVKRDLSDSFSKSETIDLVNAVKLLAVTGTQFLGTIDPLSVIPLGDFWAFAGEGTYTNAGGIIIGPGDLAIIARVGATFDSVILDIPVKSIAGIQKTSTVGLIDTYSISYSDGSTPTTFQVTNGEKTNEWQAQIYSEKSLVIKDNKSFYRVKDGQTAQSTDVPGVSDKWVLVADNSYNDLFVGSVKEFPEGYKSLTWNSNLTEGYTYFDTRCVVSDKRLLKSISAFFSLAGTIEIVIISTSGTPTVIYSEARTVTTGLNVLNFNDLSSISGTFTVGIKCITARLRTISPKNGGGFEYWKPNSSGAFTAIDWKLGYSIDVADGGIKGEIETLQIMVKSDTTNIQASIARGSKLHLDAKTYVIEETLNLPNGFELTGFYGTSILKAGINLVGDIVKIEGKENIKISNIKFEGNLSAYAYSLNGINAGTGIVATEDEALANTYIGTQNGISILPIGTVNSEKIISENLQFINLSGTALTINRSGRDYNKGGVKTSKLIMINNYKGFKSLNEHEYSTHTDMVVQLCQIGLDVDSGNLSFSGLINNRCRVGTILRGTGVNHAHGIFSGSEIKHHQLAGLLIDNVVYGHLFDGLMMQYANLSIRNSKMITIPDLFFSNGIIKCTNNLAVTGKNIIQNLYRAGSTTINNTGNLTVSNNIDLTS